MFIDFELLSDNSRVWVYQADRTLTEQEVEQIAKKLVPFVSNWKRHGDALKASFKIVYNQFVVLAVDEDYNDVSGCSIDASVHLMREIEKELNIDMFDKMKVTFKDGTNINTITLQEFKAYAKQQKINANTVVFNNMINSKADLMNAWEIEAGKSWHAKFLAS